ncbi:heparan-alpha-glucosaminide N-acetyltransferase domain-containing protein [Kitasatospora sp. NPDC048722]|uniref:heparan-alpha-glucosaminide N-acetyltransferase domain-containing protein n=1 Tax=Kitasatospora sp. NPDC048722 TaxID=3155639 RepID=UPI00340A0A7F
MTPMDPTQTSPPSNAPAGPDPVPSAKPASTGRLVGVDLARALAVFGMYAVHIGPQAASVGGVGGWPLQLSEGRASVLFATLAGFSLMLIAGRSEPKTGLAGRQAKVRIAIRAGVLIAMGTVLAAAGAGSVVILAFYGVYFLLALPLLRLRARTLAIIAAVLAVVTPLLQYGLKALVAGPVETAVNAYDPLKQLSDVGVLDLLLTGFYPTITWMTFVVTGMALGRLDLSAVTVQRRLTALGAALIAFGYGVPLLLTRFSDRLHDLAQQPSGRATGGSGSSSALDTASEVGKAALKSGGDAGAADSADAWMLLLAQPHSGSTFDMAGSLGVAITVLVGATVAMSGLPWLRRLLTPVIAVGTMSLTAYVGHFVASMALSVPLGDTAASTTPLLCFIAGAILFAAIWSRFFRRGPLEYLVNLATKPAEFVR